MNFFEEKGYIIRKIQGKTPELINNCTLWTTLACKCGNRWRMCLKSMIISARIRKKMEG